MKIADKQSGERWTTQEDQQILQTVVARQKAGVAIATALNDLAKELGRSASAVRARYYRVRHGCTVPQVQPMPAAPPPEQNGSSEPAWEVEDVPLPEQMTQGMTALRQALDAFMIALEQMTQGMTALRKALDAFWITPERVEQLTKRNELLERLVVEYKKILRQSLELERIVGVTVDAKNYQVVAIHREKESE